MRQTHIEVSEAEIIADIKTTYPGLMARPASEFSKTYASTAGVWTGGDSVNMPDGFPIFSSMSADEPEYNGFVHVGFEAWLERRGWGVEAYDAGTFLLFPLSYWDEPA